MFQANHRQVALGVLGLVLAGCTTNGLGQNDDQGIFLRSAIGNTCVGENETLTFDIDIVEVDAEGTPVENGYNDYIPGVDLTQVFDAADLDLGGQGAPTSGIWVGGDRFVALPPGTYKVTATAVSSDGFLDVELLPGPVQYEIIQVPEGGTAETTFAFQCEGQTLSALDVVVLVSEGPSITGWEYSDDKFKMICEDVGMTATFSSDVNGGPLHITFEMFQDSQDDYMGPGTGTGPVVASKSFDTFLPVGGGQTSATWDYTPPGPAGTYYVYVTAEDSSGARTTFQALLHAYDVVGDYCYIDNSWTTGAYPLVQSPGSASALTYLGTNVDQAVLTIEEASLQFVPADGTFPAKVVIQANSSLPVGADGRRISGHQTLIYSGGSEAFDIALLNPQLSAGYELFLDPSDGLYKYSGTMSYRLYDAAGNKQATGQITTPWLVSDGGTGWTLHSTKWRISNTAFSPSALLGDSRTPDLGAGVPAASLAIGDDIAHIDSFGVLAGAEICDETVELNDACMRGLELPTCDLDCTEPPPPLAEACDDPIAPTNTTTVQVGSTALVIPIPLPAAYPSQCVISVNGSGYVQGYASGNSVMVGPQTWWCDSNNVLFELSAVNNYGCTIGQLTPACQDENGNYGCAWQN